MEEVIVHDCRYSDLGYACTHMKYMCLKCNKIQEIISCLSKTKDVTSIPELLFLNDFLYLPTKIEF